MQNRQFSDLPEAINAFKKSSEAFDYSNATLSTMTGSVEEKLATFLNTIFKDLILQWLPHCPSKQSQIMALVESVENVVEEVDLVELDTVSASVLKQTNQLLAGLNAMLTDTMDPKYLPAVQALLDPKGKANSILHLYAGVIQQVPWLQQRCKAYQQSVQAMEGEESWDDIVTVSYTHLPLPTKRIV